MEKVFWETSFFVLFPARRCNRILLLGMRLELVLYRKLYGQEAIMRRTMRESIWRILAPIVSLSLVLAACATPSVPGLGGKVLESDLQRDSAPQVPAEDAAELAAGNRAFAFDFYQAVCDQGGNLFFSPHSLSVALAMTYAGARSSTEAQMAETLHYSLPQERLHPAFNALDLELASRGAGGDKEEQPFELSIANSLWGQRDYAFLPEFLDLLALNYGAGLRLSDFAGAPEAARNEINRWVEKETQGKIEDLIPEGAIDTFTRLVLANAIYFKADWLKPFEASETQDMPFYLLDGSQVQTPMMAHDGAETFPYAAGEGFQAVELPYVGEEIAMLVVVPDTGSFPAFEAGLDAERFVAIQAQMQPTELILRFPKFQFESEFALSDRLAGMGMPDAFTPGAADFSGMDGTQQLFIQDVFHKAFVAVDEKGTEAAAATAVIMGLMAMMPPDVQLTVDRPFIFAIVDKPTGSILFLGRVLNPAG
jgi:serpin B